MHGIIESFEHALTIASFVFAMMVLVDYINVLTKGGMSRAIKGKGERQYLVTSFLGVIPGCLGSFMNVSFYLRGLISFGAIAAGMIATSGDEAFVMLALFPAKALLLFGILFIISLASAPLIDKTVHALNIKTSEGCCHSEIHEVAECRASSFKEIFLQIKEISLIRFLILVLLGVFFYAFATGMLGFDVWDWKRVTLLVVSVVTLVIVITVPEHYLEEHIWNHIFKKHLWKIFLWSFGAILLVHFGLEHVDIEKLVSSNMLLVLLTAALIGLIPESGPHLIFVVLFAKGLVPFSVLLASSIVQDGHGILPLLSHSIKDTALVKGFNLVIGLIVGLTLFFLGY